MSRSRLYPTGPQQVLEHGGHARFVWNLGLEQRAMWRKGRGPTPGFAEQCRQLTEARADNPWLAAGSQTVQQQALRDLDRAFTNFFAGSHRYPTWRKAGQHEGFRIVGAQALRVRQDNRRWSSVLVPKVGWVRFRRSRALPDARSYRITRDRAGRWHIAFAAVPAPIPAPGTGLVVGIDRGVAVSAALSTGELLHAPGLRPTEAERLRRLQRHLARAQRGSNRRKALVVKIARLRTREATRTGRRAPRPVGREPTPSPARLQEADRAVRSEVLCRGLGPVARRQTCHHERPPPNLEVVHSGTIRS